MLAVASPSAVSTDFYGASVAPTASSERERYGAEVNSTYCTNERPKMRYVGATAAPWWTRKLSAMGIVKWTGRHPNLNQQGAVISALA